MISPNNKIKKVAETTSRKNLTSELETFANRVSPINANSNTMAIFMKLFATSIVANSFLGRSSRLAIICIVADLLSILSSILDLVRENSATSAPEINAEQTSNTKSNMMLMTNEVLETNKFEIKTVGSGSKIKLD